jgi:predicted GNAT family acetyltransferase
MAVQAMTSDRTAGESVQDTRSKIMTEVRNDPEQSRYEMDEQGQTAFADYRLQGDRMFIDYVFAPPALRGTGASGRLMTAVASDARARGLKITPICGYAATWLRRSAEFRDLVA